MRTCAAGLPAGAAALLLAFLKKRGFGKRGVSNFTKSFSALSFFFKGLSAPGLPCVRGEKGGSHTEPPVPHPHAGGCSRTGARVPHMRPIQQLGRRTAPFRTEAPDTLAPSRAGLGAGQRCSPRRSPRPRVSEPFLCLHTPVLCPVKPL